MKTHDIINLFGEVRRFALQGFSLCLSKYIIPQAFLIDNFTFLKKNVTMVLLLIF